MSIHKLYQGYNSKFLVDETIVEEVRFPELGDRYSGDVAPIDEKDSNILNYLNYSVQLSASRKFPIFTASNIHGELFKKATRSKSWKKDSRAKEYQWGQELYSADKSDFDKGHMTKREDVQWGNTLGIAQKAADSTFYYSNAVPQHRELNQEIWRSLEDYILHTETRKKSLKVCVFTGPVLSSKDPVFVTQVKGEKVRIPVLFWKVIVFPKENGLLYRVGFMMGQRKLLEDDGILERSQSLHGESDLFMEFEDAETYQVNVSMIEKLTDLTFSEAEDAYKDDRNIKLVLEEIDIDPDLESFAPGYSLGFRIAGLTI